MKRLGSVSKKWVTPRKSYGRTSIRTKLTIVLHTLTKANQRSQKLIFIINDTLYRLKKIKAFARVEFYRMLLGLESLIV